MGFEYNEFRILTYPFVSISYQEQVDTYHTVASIRLNTFYYHVTPAVCLQANRLPWQVDALGPAKHDFEDSHPHPARATTQYRPIRLLQAKMAPYLRR